MAQAQRIGRAARLLGVAVLATWGAADGRGAAPARPAVQTGPLIPELVGYWKLDEAAASTQALDSSGYNNHGTYSGPALSTQLPPMSNFSCNGASRTFVRTESDRVLVPDSASLSVTGSLTAAAWIRPETLPSGAPTSQWGIIEKWEWNGSSATKGYLLRLSSTRGLNFSVANDGGITANASGASPQVPTDTWSHVAMVYDAGSQQLRAYLNGTQLFTSTGAPPTDGPTMLVIGAGMDAHFFHGQIDEARIYNRALTEGEINILRTGQAPPTGLTATPGLNQVTLDWTAALGATRYAIYRADSLRPSFSLLATTTGITYTDTTAQGGVTYDYYVTAVSVMESCPSKQVSAAPLSTPPPSLAPRTGDHEEGFFDGGRCSCGSSIPAGSAPAALLAAAGLAAAAAAARRRR